VAIDPRNLKPSELCQLVNSTPLGDVINERQLYRHRTRAGFRIGDGKHVDLLRYVAWLVRERNEPKPESDGDPYATLTRIIHKAPCPVLAGVGESEGRAERE